jgi:hypothetical protein
MKEEAEAWKTKSDGGGVIGVMVNQLHGFCGEGERSVNIN